MQDDNIAKTTEPDFKRAPFGSVLAVKDLQVKSEGQAGLNWAPMGEMGENNLGDFWLFLVCLIIRYGILGF